MIYFDNAATTFPKPDCVYDAVDDYNRNHAVNAGRGAYRQARQATQMIRDVRAELTRMFHARNKAFVVLTPSVTIGINQIIGGLTWREGMHAYVSPYEHNAVLRPLHLLAQRQGIQIHQLPLREDLSIDLEQTERLFAQAPPDFVAVSAVSNVTGYILPWQAVFALAKPYKAFCLLDGAQAVGLIPMDFEETGADAITFAGHKTLYATFGIAGFLLKWGRNLDVFIAGGNGIASTALDMPEYLPERVEAGSMDTPAIAGLQAALQWLRTRDLMAQETVVMEYLIAELTKLPFVTVYKAPGDMEHQAGVVSFNVSGVDCGTVGVILDKHYQVCVRTGHHCAALIHDYLDNDVFKGTVRASVGAFSTKEDVDTLIRGLKEYDWEKAKGVSPGEAVITC